MKPVHVILLICSLSRFAEPTDLVISYKGDLKLLKNADSIERSNISIGDLHLDLKFGFPMALHYVENGRQLLVSDYDNDAIDIYSISLDCNITKPVIESIATTQIESITVDPVLHKMYWSDVFRNGIYTNSSRTKPRPNILYESNNMDPRSITLDSCNQILYWTDRNIRGPRITSFNLRTRTAKIFKSSSLKTFYHGLTFDSYDKQLWWFETNGDESSKSSCNIMKKTESGTSLYTKLESCYPFATTIDANFLYWNDWGRQAVMRLSKTNPTDILEMFSTPTDDRYRAYGIANVNHTSHFDCDVDAIREQQEIFSVATKAADKGTYDHHETQYSSSASNLHAMPFTIFPDQATSVEQMKRMYNTLHQAQLIFLLFCFLSTVIAIFILIKLYSNQNRILKSFQESNAELFLKPNDLGAEILPTCQVSKPSRKHKRFSGRIGDSYDKNSNSVDIENCCQMTLCDEPCKIAMNKARFTNKAEDKYCLLDDSMA